MAVAPRSRWTPAGIVSQLPSSLTDCQPGTGLAGPDVPESAPMAAKSRS